MTRFRLVQITVSAFVALATCTCLAQQDRLVASDAGYGFSNYEQRLADLEDVVQSLQSEQLGTGSHDCCRDYGRCPTCCPAPGIDGGGEVVFLAPHSTTGLGPQGIAFFPSGQVFATWRTWLGYTFANGVGARIRYWEFDHSVANNLNVFLYELDAYVLDVELTYSKVFGDEWDVVLSGGVRHLGIDETRVGLNNFRRNVNSDLTGVVVGGEVGRRLIGGLRGYGIARASVLFGDALITDPNTTIPIDSKSSFLWETQVGLEYRRDTRIGVLAWRVGAEVQYWDSVSYRENGSATPFTESIGLVGVVTGLTLRR